MIDVIEGQEWEWNSGRRIKILQTDRYTTYFAEWPDDSSKIRISHQKTRFVRNWINAPNATLVNEPPLIAKDTWRTPEGNERRLLEVDEESVTYESFDRRGPYTKSIADFRRIIAAENAKRVGGAA